MRTLILLLVAALASCGAEQDNAKSNFAPPAPSPLYRVQVVATYPHDTRAFTEGLFYEGGLLYESTGLEGQSFIRKERLETGEVLLQRDLSVAYFGEGIVNWQGRLLELTWQSQKGFIYNFTDFKPIGEFVYPGEGWALTKNDKFIIMSDGTADLRFLNPTTLAEDHRITVTLNGQGLRNVNELEWIKGEIWANVWQTDVIVRIDPVSGRVIGRIDASGLLTAADRAGGQTDVLNGIAYDAEKDRIFVTGKKWPKLFEIKLVPAQ
jgi:glutamine cyclotransferase